jgi:hypothetical protein
LLEFEDCDALGMDGYENSVNRGLGIFIKDREVHLDPRHGVGNALAASGEWLLSPTLGTFLRQIKSEDSKLFGALVKIVQG